ncbi:MAG: helicase-related protein [Candidatus Micrarchaeota archaeon]|nr:helicase-related protein [Candidatus Micrarchaeota archaeon]
MDGLPLRKGFEARDYQARVAEGAARANTLVVMPTALGKTFVALLVMAALLKKNPGAKFLFLAPTKPLAAQQARRIKELLEIGGDVVLATGEMNPVERKKAYAAAQVVSATPQCIENDLAKDRIDLAQYALIVFDEAHRAVGDYAYVPIGAAAKRKNVLVLGLTASPSSEKEKVREVCDNLGIAQIESRGLEDADVLQYVKRIEFDWVFVKLPPEIVALRAMLLAMVEESAKMITAYGFSIKAKRPNKKQLLLLRGQMLRQLPKTYKALSELARAINLVHAVDLLESQGVEALLNFLEGMAGREEKSKAVIRLLADPRVDEIKLECRSLLAAGIEHPKAAKLKEIVERETLAGNYLIVFVHYRDSAKNVLRDLNKIKGVDARLLVGRSGDGGMKQKEQIGLVDSFREKEFNVLVATQVGEEGLDIPAVDEVVFYEAVPSEIRLIQRRGRAGRVKAGRAVVLVAEDTKDEAYLWISKRKEKTMKKTLAEMKKEMHDAGVRGGEKREAGTGGETRPSTGQKSIGEFF